MKSAAGGRPEDVMDDVQMGMSVAVTKEAMNFQASMSANLINGSLEKGVEMQQTLARSAGLAAEGIGGKLDVVA